MFKLQKKKHLQPEFKVETAGLTVVVVFTLLGNVTPHNS